MDQDQDYWSQDEFEDTVVRTLLAGYETKIGKLRGAHPQDRLTASDYATMHRQGLYVPSNSRLITANAGSPVGTFDLELDPLPVQGTLAANVFRSWGRELVLHRFCRASKMPKHWSKQHSGTLFALDLWFSGEDRLRGERRYFTVGKGGEVVPCHAMFQTGGGHTTRVIELPYTQQVETAQWSSICLQFEADKRHSWSITAREDDTTSVTLGCMREEVKSLLYARSLPVTATGRKRPILHLVSAHKRRIKSGVDVNIDEFLRGVRTVEILGTQFSVNPPDKLTTNKGE